MSEWDFHCAQDGRASSHQSIFDFPDHEDAVTTPTFGTKRKAVFKGSGSAKKDAADTAPQANATKVAAEKEAVLNAAADKVAATKGGAGKKAAAKQAKADAATKAKAEKVLRPCMTPP